MWYWASEPVLQAELGFTGNWNQVLASAGHFVRDATLRTSWFTIGCRRQQRRKRRFSVLGPFLFCMFTTPVDNLIDSFVCVTYHQYADDTQLCTITNLRSDRLASLSACAYAVTSWRLKNDLLLNPIEMEAIATGTRPAHRDIRPVARRCGCWF